ncbi:uncharacterized protein JCM15063_002769 [Sporobolomyces koalae]|uniref:uncharacterized protein n=1 Tax=Sporobolomyces koalae TaxID=500713 RepID=UPI00317D5830
MPSKRSAEEVGRPPLSRGSACHRCFARKVRCSGQPDPSTGVHACNSCLRTARFKNHDISQVKCAFNGEGLCSEEGGLQLNGEAISTPTGPTRRRLVSRTSTNSSGRSTSSRASSYSSRSDVSVTSSTDSTTTVSPPSSLESVPTMGKLGLDVSAAPQIAMSTFAPLPLPEHFISLYESAVPPPLQLPYSHSQSSSSQASRCSSPSPKTPVDPQPSLFARRSVAQMHITLPGRTSSVHSPTESVSTMSSTAQSLPSAPLQTPTSWGNSALSATVDVGVPYHMPAQLPLTQLALDLAPFSALSPSVLTKFSAGSAPYFDLSAPPPLQDYPEPETVGGALGFGQIQHVPPELSSLSYGYGVSAAPSFRPYYPPAPTPPGQPLDSFSLDDPCAFNPSAFAGSLHLPSPGLTFSSSTPSWYPQSQYFYA